MKNLAITIALMLSAFTATAQSGEAFTWTDKEIWPESPTAATIREVTSPRPALVTGAAEFSVPLYTLDAEGLSIPFEYRYHSNGIRVDDDPCPWGHGWTLSPSIRLSRRILGRPDGLFTSVADKASLSHNECYHAMTDSVLDLGATTFPSFYTDACPDIFTVQLPSGQFSFMFREGKAITACKDEFRIEADSTLTEFTVTDPYGYVYKFDVAGEFSIASAFTTEWFPSTITCPSGRKVVFSYRDYKSYIRNLPHQAPRIFTYEKSGNIKTYGASLTGESHQLFDNGKLLTSVSFAGHSVEISYLGGVKDMHIASLVAKAGSKTIKSYSFNFDTTSHTPLSIIGDAGTYSFECYPLPDNNYAKDWWGYYTRNTGSSVTLYANLDFWSGPKNFHCGMGPRNVDEDYMKSYMLRKVVYPTGGSAEWDYEMHRFADFESQRGGAVYIHSAPVLNCGGGLRVKSIMMRESDDDETPQIVDYTYGENGDGLAVCEYAPTLDTFIQLRDYVSYIPPESEGVRGRSAIITKIYILPESNYLENHIGVVPIWYPEITEVSAEGKTVYNFENFIIEDSPGIYEPFGDGVLNIGSAFSSGPQLVKQTVFKSTSNSYAEVYCEEMEYDDVFGTTCFGHSIKRKLYSDGLLVNYSAPDFTGKLVYNWYTICEGPAPGDDYPALNPLNFNENSVYMRQQISIEPYRTRLAAKTMTETREGGKYVTSQSFSYVDDTDLLAQEQTTGPTGTVVRTLTYPDKNVSAVQSQMVAANLKGIAIGQTVSCGTTVTSVRADMKRFGTASVFRPVSVYRRRGTSPEYAAATVQWDSKGNLLSSTDRAGVVSSYTWDTSGRYPLAMTVGGLRSTAEWEPGVGVKSMTAPSGIKSVYTYDAAGRLKSTGISGIGTLMSWDYAISQSGDNYVRQTTWRSSSASSDHPYTRSNFNGLGRKVSDVSALNQSGWKYIASAVGYDDMGRPVRTYSAASVGTDSPTESDVASAASSYYGDDRPWSVTSYEPSQRGVAVATLKAGSAWHTGDHKATVRRRINNAGTYKCARYEVGSDGSIRFKGYYATGALTVDESTDEDGVKILTYTDFRGNTVMRKQGAAGTRYIYDDYGDLRYILPPDMSDTSYPASSAALLSKAYIYRYDDRGRLVYSKIPGRGASEYVYDDAGRLVAENDADLGSRWRLHFYDKAGREVLVTEATMTVGAAVRTQLAQPRTAVAGAPGSGLKGYSVDFTFPADNSVRLAVYYDDYASQTSLPSAGGTYLSAPAGLKTGMWAATDDNGGVSEMYRYDSAGRETCRVTDRADCRIITSTSYNYAGQPVTTTDDVYDKTKATWQKHTVTRTFAYDGGGRMTQERTLYAGHPAVITDYTYDAVGQVSKTVIGLESATAGQVSPTNVSREYTYDVHGWPVKIVTGVPRTLVLPASLDISGDYYSTAAAHNDIVVRGPFDIEPARQRLTETIHYADGTTPRYNGTPSARGLTQGGRYDYRYDSYDRLIAADYIAPESAPDADFSTEYTYDILARVKTVKRHGIVDLDGTTEVFGMLDDLSMTYEDGRLSRMASNITDQTGRNFYGRTGWYYGTYMPSCIINYNDAGRLIKDSGRMLETVVYNTLGLPTLYSVSGQSPSTSPRRERVYDATGRKVRQTEYEYIRGVQTATSDRRYMGSYTFNADTLERIDFTGGYFDGRGNAHFMFTDWQGNVTITTDSSGEIEQHIGYYPYGEPWREPSGQRSTLFAGKERLSGQSAGDYDFGPRGLRSTAVNWDGADRNAGDYPWWSPWSYCGGNPIKFCDPTGDDALIIVCGSVITVKANIILYGDDISDDLVKEYQRKIDEVWGKKDKCRPYTVKWDVTVVKETENDEEQNDEEQNYDGKNNYMEVQPKTGPDSKKRSGVINNCHGYIRQVGRLGLSLKQDNPMAHEFGHMLGLADRYKNVGETSVPDKGFEHDVMGAKTIEAIITVSDLHLLEIFDEPLFRTKHLPVFSDRLQYEYKRNFSNRQKRP